MYFKKSWKVLSKKPIKDTYKTNVNKWQCDFGNQALHKHHLCKHLVQAMPEPPLEFWRQILRCRTVPTYRHPCLQGVDTTVDKSISDGDNHIWMGDWNHLENGGWRRLLGANVSNLPRKCKCADSTNDSEQLIPDDKSGLTADANGNSNDNEEVLVAHHFVTICFYLISLCRILSFG